MSKNVLWVVARLPKRLKSTFFEKQFFNPMVSLGPLRSKKFQKTLILAFEVIVQPLKAHFLTFSGETKIMKITHSAVFYNPQNPQNPLEGI